jgi:hypothetical protein
MYVKPGLGGQLRCWDSTVLRFSLPKPQVIEIIHLRIKGAEEDT